MILKLVKGNNVLYKEFDGEVKKASYTVDEQRDFALGDYDSRAIGYTFETEIDWDNDNQHLDVIHFKNNGTEKTLAYGRNVSIYVCSSEGKTIDKIAA